MRQSLIEHVLMRLKKLGITEVFGVPGDFSFGVTDAICADPDLHWIANSNELNAAYAAASPWMKGVWNDQPHPSDLYNLYQRAQEQGYTPPDAPSTTPGPAFDPAGDPLQKPNPGQGGV